jgi:hypothetical protein
MAHNILETIDPEEISLVKRQAVPTAKIAIAKHAPQLSASDAVRKIVEIAKSGAPGTLRKCAYLWALKKCAEHIRKDDESEAQAFSRFATSTDDGRALYDAQVNAPEAEGTEAETVKPSQAKADEMTIPWAKILRLADELRRTDPQKHKTREQAVSAVLMTPEGAELNHAHRMAQGAYARQKA